MIILGTNVLSESLRPEPTKQVGRGAAQDGAGVYFTTVGEAKPRHGVVILLAGTPARAYTTIAAARTTSRRGFSGRR